MYNVSMNHLGTQDDGTIVEIENHNGQQTVKPLTDERRRTLLKEAIDRVLTRHAVTFQKLAK